MSQVLPFILCGGSGTRLWPLSREAFPKQFHKIAGDETLFQQACRRVTQGMAGKPIVLSGHKHRFLLTIHLPIASVRRLAMVNTETHNAACDKMDLFPQQNRGWNAPEVRSRLVLPRAEAPLPPTPLKLLGTQSSAPEADDSKHRSPNSGPP